MNPNLPTGAGRNQTSVRYWKKRIAEVELQLKEVMKLYTAEKLLRDELDTEVIRLDDLNRSRLDTCQEVIEERDSAKLQLIDASRVCKNLRDEILKLKTIRPTHFEAADGFVAGKDIDLLISFGEGFDDWVEMHMSFDQACDLAEQLSVMMYPRVNIGFDPSDPTDHRWDGYNEQLKSEKLAEQIKDAENVIGFLDIQRVDSRMARDYFKKWHNINDDEDSKVAF
jgi:hypothetical protein